MCSSPDDCYATLLKLSTILPFGKPLTRCLCASSCTKLVALKTGVLLYAPPAAARDVPSH